MTMPTKATPTDIRYEYMRILDMTNIFLYLFAKIISFTILSSIIIYMILFWKEKIYMNRLQFVSSKEKRKSWPQMMFLICGCDK
jgi:hypothetical protein